MYYKHYWKFYFKALNFDWKKFLRRADKAKKKEIDKYLETKEKGFLFGRGYQCM